MPAAKLDLPPIEKGATYRQVLLWKDPGNVAINLTGCAARMQVRETLTATAALLELSTGNLGLLITPELGKIELYITAQATTLLPGLGGVYDLEVHLANSDVVRLIEGKIPFKDQVTHD